MSTPSICYVCSAPASKGCAGCKKAIRYCDKAHQASDWPRHKLECTGRRTKQAAAANEQGPASWAVGLAPAQQFEWLTDCYRMRVDDDYCWGGDNLHGLYDPDSTNLTIMADFLVFCKLAVLNKVIPRGWNWSQFLSTAAKLNPYAFEKSDAQEKYGEENVFSGMFGGRSLRTTGIDVYGSGPTGGEEPSECVTCFARCALATTYACVATVDRCMCLCG